MINITQKNIGIKISGGADSALVAYLLAKHIIDNGLETKIFPIIIIEEDAPFQKIFATQVLDIVQGLTNYKFETAQAFLHQSGTDKIQLMRDIEFSLKNKLELIVSGTTQNPKGEFNEPNGPVDNRNGEFPELWDNWIYTPLINLDKREIANLYKEHNLMESLFPYTRSCVAVTKDFTKHCGECWWCKERIYGFGKL